MMEKIVKAWGIVLICFNWSDILQAKIFGKPIEQIRMRNGAKFKVEKTFDIAELSILTDIWHRHVYDPVFLTIQPSDLVVDVGSNKGYFAIYAASKTQNMIYALEPYPAAFDYLNQNIALNKFKNITSFNLGLWDRSGSMPFYISSNSGGHSMRPKPSTIDSMTVPVLTLADFCRQNRIEKIDFLKLDCEGAEYDILLNLDREFMSKIKKIAMETHEFGNYHPSAVREFLAKNNFQIRQFAGYLYGWKN